jgi:hypothetical protein
MDISVAQALGLQFRSSYNILRFYDLRERLLYGPAESRKATLLEMRGIVEEEIQNGTAMAMLCEVNPFLGFHSEAEAYKYFPAKLQWRVERLRALLVTEFAEADRAIVAGSMVFPAISGMTNESLAYTCRPAPASFAASWRTEGAWQALAADTNAGDALLTPSEPAVSWRAVHDADALYLDIRCAVAEHAPTLAATVHIQSAHIYPRRTFTLDEKGTRNTQLGWLVATDQWEAESAVADGFRTFRFRIPFQVFNGEFDRATYPLRPMRINIQVQSTPPEAAAPVVQTWASISANPPRYRLGYGGEDPAEMGWLQIMP